MINRKSLTVAKEIRRRIVRTANISRARGCHLGGALSCVDFISVILNNYKINSDIDPKSARITLSKGHACLSIYCTLNYIGKISDDELLQFEENGSYLAGHPIRNKEQGIYFSTGSLGIGMSNAVGQAIYLKKKYGEMSPKVIAILGDGEASEGIVYESLCVASKYSLDNLLIFIDDNGLQQTGRTQEISGKRNLELIAKGSGANTLVVDDGNDHDKIEKALAETKRNNVNCIIGKTVKGKGISFMEHDNKWHHGKMTTDEYIQAFNELK